MDLLFFGLIVWAFADVARDLKTRLGLSREARIAEREQQLAPRQMSATQRRATAARHDTGWWLREIFTGFPTARHGWHAGWVAHQAAVEQQRGIVDHHRSLRDRWHAARLQGLKNEVELAKGDVQAAGDDRPPLSRAEMKDRLKAGSPPAQPRPDDPVTAAKAAHPASQPGNGQVFITDWPPMRVPPEPGAAGADDTPAVPAPPPLVPEPAPAPATPIQGETVPAQTPTAETTYSQDLSKCNQIIAACDVEGVRLRMQQAALWVEQMVAAGLDPGNTTRASELADQIEEQIKQNQRTHDAAMALKDGIQQHSAGHDYHTSFPGGGASREYLRD